MSSIVSYSPSSLMTIAIDRPKDHEVDSTTEPVKERALDPDCYPNLLLERLD